MATLKIAAHCVDDEFRATLAAVGVTITDETNAPWEWTFEGPKQALLDLLAEHWQLTGAAARHYLTGD